RPPSSSLFPYTTLFRSYSCGTRLRATYMVQRGIVRRLVLVAAACVLASVAAAEPVWVTDQFEITLRTGPSNGHAITRMLPTGTQDRKSTRLNSSHVKIS